MATTAYAPFGIVQDPTALGLRVDNVHIDGANIAVYAKGATRDRRRPIVFLHGVNMDWTSWTPLIQAAQANNYDYSEWIFVDLPGFGRSSALKESDTIASIGSTIVKLFSAIGLAKPNVVGHSMGGFLLMDIAVRFPSALSQATVISGTYKTVVDLVNNPFSTVATSPKAAFTYLPLAVAARAGVERLPVPPAWLLHPYTLNWALGSVFSHPSKLDRSIISSLVGGYVGKSFLIAEATGRGYDVERTWRRLHLPLTAIFGAKDAIVPARDVEQLSQLVPNARITNLADTGHFSHIERPFDCLELLIASTDGLEGNNR